MNRTRIAIVIAVVVLVVGGIALGVSQRSESSLSSEASQAVSADIQAGASSDEGKRQGLPSFQGTKFGGGTLATSDITGPAVIHVFASWCPSCQSEAPAFAQLQREHPDLNYYFIAVDDSEDAATEFAKKYGWKAGATIDDNGRKVESAFGLSGQPHTIFVSADGSITTHKGPGSFGDLDTFARAIA